MYNQNPKIEKISVTKVLILGLLCVIWANLAEAQYARCLNPNQRAGLCVAIGDCQTLYSVLQRNELQQSVKDFIRASSCSGASYAGNRPFVCCTSDTDFARSRQGTLAPVFGYYDDDNDFGWPGFPPPTRTVLFPANADFNSATASPWRFGAAGGRRRSTDGFQLESTNVILPQPPSCGGVTIENKIYGGEDAAINEFPWMVLMEYRRRTGSLSTNCAGSLINQRYVLTAAHCVTGRIEREIGQLMSVRLGEHDTRSQKGLRLHIEEARAHELYKEKSPNQVHDIALVRLERNVRFTDSMRPICLPSVVAQEQKQAGQQYTVAGWGRTLQSTRSPVKQKLNVAYVEPEQCRSKFGERKISIVATQLCAGGKYAQDSCDGDSGGPLMRFRNGAWVLEGIVSFGFKCGLKDWPGVYTSVAAYDDWIRRTMRA